MVENETLSGLGLCSWWQASENLLYIISTPTYVVCNDVQRMMVNSTQSNCNSHFWSKWLVYMAITGQLTCFHCGGGNSPLR